MEHVVNGMGRHVCDGEARVALGKQLAEHASIGLRHPYIRDDQVDGRVLSSEEAECLLSARRLQNAVSGIPEYARREREHEMLVIDDQDVPCCGIRTIGACGTAGGGELWHARD